MQFTNWSVQSVNCRIALKAMFYLLNDTACAFLDYGHTGMTAINKSIIVLPPLGCWSPWLPITTSMSRWCKDVCHFLRMPSEPSCNGIWKLSNHNFNTGVRKSIKQKQFPFKWSFQNKWSFKSLNIHTHIYIYLCKYMSLGITLNLSCVILK